VRSMIRPAWQGEEWQKKLLAEAVKAVQISRSTESAAWAAIQLSRAAGVPDDVLCLSTEISRSTLNRKLGKRPRRDAELELSLRGDDVPGDATKPERQPVVAAIVTSERGVLVGRRNDGKPPWTFIAGEIEPGESQADAAVREVKEETGLVIEPAPHEIGRRVHPKTQRTMLYLACTPRGELDPIVGDPEELAEVRWMSLAEVEGTMGVDNIFGPVLAHLRQELAL
jgi:8-oxo-dGTP pyrophosphatase MutT (NUDIX family)